MRLWAGKPNAFGDESNTVVSPPESSSPGSGARKVDWVSEPREASAARRNALANKRENLVRDEFMTGLEPCRFRD